MKRYKATSEGAKRIAAIMHRQLTTCWTQKEVKTYKALCPIPEEDLAVVERYYRVLWPPRTGVNILRHDIATLLNNWPGEVDRARIWCEKHPPKPKSKVIPFPTVAKADASAPVLTAEQEAAELERKRAIARAAKERILRA